MAGFSAMAGLEMQEEQQPPLLPELLGAQQGEQPIAARRLELQGLVPVAHGG